MENYVISSKIMLKYKNYVKIWKIMLKINNYVKEIIC